MTTVIIVLLVAGIVGRIAQHYRLAGAARGCNDTTADVKTLTDGHDELVWYRELYGIGTATVNVLVGLEDKRSGEYVSSLSLPCEAHGLELWVMDHVPSKVPLPKVTQPTDARGFIIVPLRYGDGPPAIYKRYFGWDLYVRPKDTATIQPGRPIFTMADHGQ